MSDETHVLIWYGISYSDYEILHSLGCKSTKRGYYDYEFYEYLDYDCNVARLLTKFDSEAFGRFDDGKVIWGLNGVEPGYYYAKHWKRDNSFGWDSPANEGIEITPLSSADGVCADGT